MANFVSSKFEIYSSLGYNYCMKATMIMHSHSTRNITLSDYDELHISNYTLSYRHTLF